MWFIILISVTFVICFFLVCFGHFLFVIIFDYFFFVRQNTEYEWRISDWSSDVCSSDLEGGRGTGGDDLSHRSTWRGRAPSAAARSAVRPAPRCRHRAARRADRRQDCAYVRRGATAAGWVLRHDPRQPERANRRSETRRVWEEGVSQCRPRVPPIP